MFLIILFLGAIGAALYWVYNNLDCDLVTLYYSKYGKPISDIKGKVVWITGASSGIGKSLALTLAEQGARVIVSGTRVDAVNEVRASCLKWNKSLAKKDVLALPFDLADIAGHEAHFKKVIEHFGKLDILVNNAGRYQVSGVEDGTNEVDKAVFDVNVFAPFSLTRLAVNHWYSTGQQGHVVVTSSFYGKASLAGTAIYTASKFALHGFFENLRVEGYKRGVSVTMTVPGGTETELFNRSHTGSLESGQQVPRPSANLMSPDRCAELMAVAIVNQLAESWTMLANGLIPLYFSQYLPSVYRWLMPRVLPSEMVENLKKG